MDSNANSKKQNGGQRANGGNIRVVGDPNSSCGLSFCRPSWIQFLANPKIFTAHCTAIVALLICSFAYFGGILTTVERQFQLSSSESGTITIINDVVSLIFVLPASYFGYGSNRPRWIASGTILTGIGIFMLSMPHFATQPVDTSELLFKNTIPGLGGPGICKPNTEAVEALQSSYMPTDQQFLSNQTTNYTSTNITVPAFNDGCDSTSNGLGPIWWIVIGNVIVGIGSAPMYPLITTYIDDAVGKRKLVSYMAFLFMAFAIGPSFGFLLSAQTTKLYVDFDRIPADEVPDIEQSDPRWIGAWWLGFAFCGSLMIILGFPMFLYPRHMVVNSEDSVEDGKKSDEKGDDNDVSNAFTGTNLFAKKDGQSGIIDVIKDSLFAMKRLVTNKTLMFMCLAGSAETATIGIFAAFVVKYLQTQFGLSPGTSGMLVGGAIIPCNIVSNLISAWIVRRFKLTSRQCALLVIIVLGLSGIVLPILMAVGCNNPHTAGITVPYGDHYVNDSTGLDNDFGSDKLVSSCNMDCQCATDVFQPVCGSDGITYISPCLAGCTGKVFGNGTDNDDSPSQNVFYTNCTCTLSSSDSDNTATAGQCPPTCASFKLPLFVILCALSFFTMALTGNPLIFILLRCVESDDRSLALGLKSLITKVLGFFPSPVYFGAIINATCLYWQYTCDERGACWLYDIVKYRYSYFGTLLVLRVCGLFCYVLMYFTIKKEEPTSVPEESKNPDEYLKLSTSKEMSD